MSLDSQSDILMDDADSGPGSDSELEPEEAVDETSTKPMADINVEPEVINLTNGLLRPSAPVAFETAPDFEMQFDDPMAECESDSSFAEANSQQQSRLLSLPTEIFQFISWYMDVGTFFASFLTCRQFMIAARSKPLLLRHIHNIPGLRPGLEDLSTADLLDQFSKRAAESSYGAGVLADVTRYAPRSKTPLSNAVFSPRR